MRYVLIFCLLLVIGCGRFGMMEGIEQHPEGAWGYFFGNSDPDWDFYSDSGWDWNWNGGWECDQYWD